MAAHSRGGSLATFAGLAFALAFVATTLAGPVASACTEPDCVKGVPPATAGHPTTVLPEDSDPKCVSGTQPG